MSATELEIRPRQVPGAKLVTAKSYLIDRIIPSCETVLLPELTLRSGRMTIESGEVRLHPQKRRRLSRLVRKADETVPPGRWAFDMRRENPENWAHFLNDHLPIFFKAADVAGRDPAKALLLLPSDVPEYIPKAAAVFGLTCRATDAMVEGDGISLELDPFISNRTDRHEWVRLPYPRSVLERIFAAKPIAGTPEKVFLIRMGQRALSNHSEVEAWLSARGFVPVLPESLPAEEQLRLFLNAREMVSLSGACLAPLLFTQAPERGPERLIELQPCGHMSSVYREMAHMVGTHFVGVRGRIKPEYVRPAYDFRTPFLKFSQDDFHVDTDSLDLAFRL